MNKSIEILIVEDHDATTLGIETALMNSSLPCSVYAMDNADDALNYIQRQPVDFLILDISLKPNPKMKLKDGDELLVELRRAKSDIKVIAMTMLDSLEMIDYLMNYLKADGYIYKSRRSLNELEPAIETILQGKKYTSPSIRSKMGKIGLTDIDFTNSQILLALSNGVPQVQLPQTLESKGIILSLSSIEKRLHKLRSNVGASSTTELVRICIQEGIITV